MAMWGTAIHTMYEMTEMVMAHAFSKVASVWQSGNSHAALSTILGEFMPCDDWIVDLHKVRLARAARG